MLKLFKVSYKGSWCGGNAVVVASSEEEVRKLLENDYYTSNFVDVEIKEIDMGIPSVVCNDDGDY